MARLGRAEVFAPDEIAIVHAISRVVRRCFLLGDDPVSGENFDHRKGWIELRLQHLARHFGIDLLTFSCLSNHFHLVLRSRPDVVETWDDTEVARRWFMLCPARKQPDGTPEQPNQQELNSIRHDPEKLTQIRLRLSDISWWMRLLNQHIAQRANREDNAVGKFFQGRFEAVRLLDEESLLACAAYVDLNPIRAALAETLEQSDFTSVQRRIESLQQTSRGNSAQTDDELRDCFLAPLTIDERQDALGACPHSRGHRCSDKGFLAIRLEDYLELLDWTARQTAAGKRGTTPMDAPPILARLSMSAATWCELVHNFGRLFYNVAGIPRKIEMTRTRKTQRRFHMTSAARELFTAG